MGIRKYVVLIILCTIGVSRRPLSSRRVPKLVIVRDMIVATEWEQSFVSLQSSNPANLVDLYSY